jgi:chromosome segregation ATPase
LNTATAVILIVAAAVVFGVVGFVLGQVYRKKVAEAAIGSAQDEAARILNQAMTEAESRRKEIILEAKEKIQAERTEADKELRERRNEVKSQERRIIQKEESLDKKVEAMEKKEETLNKKLRDADEKLQEVESLKRSHLDMLEKISGYSKEQAKAYLLQNLDEELVHDKAVKIYEYEQKKKKREMEKKNRAAAKATEVKDLRFPCNGGDADRERILNQGDEFMEQGHPVNFCIRFPGRKVSHCDDVIERTKEEMGNVLKHGAISKISRAGNNFTIFCMPKR